MYTEQDRIQIRQRIRKYGLITLPILVVLMVGYVMGMKERVQMLSMVTGCLTFAVVCFTWMMFFWPCIRYLRFLKDMDEGLTREMSGSIVEISEQEDLQDGVRVLPVRILLSEEEGERIVYLNATKAERFPKAGAEVCLHCFGRHIKEVAPRTGNGAKNEEQKRTGLRDGTAQL